MGTTCAFVRMDMNGDGLSTISDIWSLIGAVFYFPGNLVIDWLSQSSKVAAFLEITPGSCGNGSALAISIIFWLIAFGVFGAITDR